MTSAMPSPDFNAQRLFVGAGLAAGLLVACSQAQTNYLVNVLRLGDGVTIRVFNGQHGEWIAKLVREGKRRLSLQIGEQIRPQQGGPDIDYLFAPLKRTRLDYMVQKATELGAARLRPVLTQHTTPERVNLERMRANVIEAAEQCGILRIPEVAEPQRLEAVLAGWDSGRRLVFCDESAEVGDPIAALSGLGPATPLAVLIGPEGGFSTGERAALLALPGALRLSLGPRIMRADTAAVAALALVNAVAGDWR